MLWVGLLLSVVTASLAELLSVGRLPNIGLFSAAFGLVVLSMRGGDMRDLLLVISHKGGSANATLYYTLAAEAGVWAMVLAAAYVTSAWLRRWLSANGRAEGPAAQPVSATRQSVDGVRTPGAVLPLDESASAGEIVRNVSAMLAVGALAMLLIQMMAADSPVGAIRTGQVFFSVGAGFFLASWLATQVFPDVPIGWLIAAVPAAAMVGCVLAANGTGFTGAGLQGYNDVTTVPANAFTRALPIEHVAVGVLGVLMGSRSGVMPTGTSSTGAEPKSGS
jgi:hypothetical protein